MKLKVKNEGREGVYLIDKKEAINKLIKRRIIHGYINSTTGCDYDRISIISLIKQADSVAILCEPNETMNHQLVVIGKMLVDKWLNGALNSFGKHLGLTPHEIEQYKNQTNRYSFDVGTITTKDLIIIE